jgi:hypothetical protein
MHDPQPILKGTWSEILSHKDDIPGTRRVLVIPDPAETSEADVTDPEQVRLQTVLDACLDQIEGAEFTPPEGPLPAATQAVVDKFRRKGLTE